MTIAPTKEFFYEHFIKPQAWTTTADQVDYRLVRDEDRLLIVFQQSQGPECYNGRKDWLRNIKAFWKWSSFFKCFFHKGFITSFELNNANIFARIFTNIKNYNLKNLYFTGYSQGAPLARLFYAALKLTNFEDIILHDPITFADPGGTWCLFFLSMRKLFKNSRLVMTRKDIVPKVLRWLGYWHIGKKEYLEEPKGYQHPASIPEWMQKTYHYPDYYLACLPSEKEVSNEQV